MGRGRVPAHHLNRGVIRKLSLTFKLGRLNLTRDNCSIAPASDAYVSKRICLLHMALVWGAIVLFVLKVGQDQNVRIKQN